MADEQFLHLTGVVKTTEGYRTIRQGDTLPDNLAEGEEERLRRVGAYGEPQVPEAPADLAGATDEELAAFVAGASAKEVVERAGDDPELAERLLAIEQDGKDRKTAVEGLEAIADGDTQ